MRIDQAHPAQGKLAFELRSNHPESKLAVVYDQASSAFSIEEHVTPGQGPRILAATGLTVEPGVWIPFRAAIDSEGLHFDWDGQPLFRDVAVTKDAWGGVGIETRHLDLSIDDVAMDGAPVYPGVTDRAAFAHRLEGSLLEIKKGHIESAHLHSIDGGVSWAPGNLISAASANMTRLADGTLLLSRRQKHATLPDAFKDYVLRSTDNGTTWSEPFFIQANWKNRITIPRVFLETRSGRIFFPSGESGDGLEVFGGVWVYYSDDGGRSWTRSETLHDYDTFGLNLQEGRLIELRNGDLKAFFRTDQGFIHQSLSQDQGQTWSAPTPTPLQSPLMTLQVLTDPRTGFHYMLWGYNELHPHHSVLNRTRLSLAVSYDDTKTWHFALDVADWAGNPYRFVNQSADWIGGELWVVLPTQTGSFDWPQWTPGSWEGRLVRIDVGALHPAAQFPPLHTLSAPKACTEQDAAALDACSASCQGVDAPAFLGCMITQCLPTLGALPKRCSDCSIGTTGASVDAISQGAISFEAYYESVAYSCFPERP